MIVSLVTCQPLLLASVKPQVLITIISVLGGIYEISEAEDTPPRTQEMLNLSKYDQRNLLSTTRIAVGGRTHLIHSTFRVGRLIQQSIYDPSHKLIYLLTASPQPRPAVLWDFTTILAK